jgi:hypothetical protein
MNTSYSTSTNRRVGRWLETISTYRWFQGKPSPTFTLPSRPQAGHLPSFLHSRGPAAHKTRYSSYTAKTSSSPLLTHETRMLCPHMLSTIALKLTSPLIREGLGPRTPEYEVDEVSSPQRSNRQMLSFKKYTKPSPSLKSLSLLTSLCQSPAVRSSSGRLRSHKVLERSRCSDWKQHLQPISICSEGSPKHTFKTSYHH